MISGPIEHKTSIRFRHMEDFESYVNAKDVECVSGDVTLTGYVHKINTPQFEVVKRSAYAKVTNCM